MGIISLPNPGAVCLSRALLSCFAYYVNVGNPYKSRRRVIRSFVPCSCATEHLAAINHHSKRSNHRRSIRSNHHRSHILHLPMFRKMF